jgi:ribonuclease HI
MTGILAQPVVTIYTDGACSPNPGAGGWAYLVYQHGEEIGAACGAVPATTNNRMELAAAVEALDALTRPCVVTLHTDSTYVANAATSLRYWRRTRPPACDLSEADTEAELWWRLADAAERHHITWQWIRGHSGIPGNESANTLAGQASIIARTTGITKFFSLRSSTLVGPDRYRPPRSSKGLLKRRG